MKQTTEDVIVLTAFGVLLLLAYSVIRAPTLGDDTVYQALFVGVFAIITVFGARWLWRQVKLTLSWPEEIRKRRADRGKLREGGGGDEGS